MRQRRLFWGYRASRFNSLERACPAVVEGEGLGEGLANDVACLVGIE